MDENVQELTTTIHLHLLLSRILLAELDFLEVGGCDLEPNSSYKIFHICGLSLKLKLVGFLYIVERRFQFLLYCPLIIYISIIDDHP